MFLVTRHHDKERITDDLLVCDNLDQVDCSAETIAKRSESTSCSIWQLIETRTGTYRDFNMISYTHTENGEVLPKPNKPKLEANNG